MNPYLKKFLLDNIETVKNKIIISGYICTKKPIDGSNLDILKKNKDININYLAYINKIDYEFMEFIVNGLIELEGEICLKNYVGLGIGNIYIPLNSNKKDIIRIVISKIEPQYRKYKYITERNKRNSKKLKYLGIFSLGLLFGICLARKY